MTEVLLIQLPIPRLNYGRRTGNIPLAAACLKQACADVPGVRIEVLPESVASFIGDAALLDLIAERRPEIVGFTAFSWNIERILFLSRHLKKTLAPGIVLGGPEITRDNRLADSGDIDFYVYGDGEAVFRRLLQDPSLWRQGQAQMDAAEIFRRSPSPYLAGGLEPHIENIMLLETQRGCPYRCAFCYYNKSHGGLVFVERDRVLEAVQWAFDSGVDELFLLDPSLNVRPDLPALLRDIQRINRNRRLAIFSEIRAEGIDARLAESFAAAGFKGFETGLQTTNPEALKLMRRSASISRFLTGTRLLKANGIGVAVDLIMGLPADTPAAFRKSVDLVADSQLVDDVQLFPLALLPGTEFRRRHRELGLKFDPHPPYTVEQTPAFGQEQFLEAVDYAESRLGTVFFPPPALDIAWRFPGDGRRRSPADVYVCLGADSYLNKLILFDQRPTGRIADLARRLSFPYQVFVGPRLRDPAYLGEVIEMLTEINPFSALEVVLLDPADDIAGMDLAGRVRLRRPHFLDGDLRYMFARPGNRAALFTLVCPDARIRFQADMQRQIYWWRAPRLPARQDLEALFELDGVLVDAPVTADLLRGWQDRFAPLADDLPHVGFADLALHKRWIELTAADDYANGAMDYVSR